MRLSVSLALAMAAGIGLVGCMPNQGYDKLQKALTARVDREPTFTDSAKFVRTYVDKHDADYVMWAMDYSSLCMLGGNYDAAKVELLKCWADIKNRTDTDKEKAAAISNEAAKIFKGEPYERAMVCTYLGLLHYMDGDYNNARIFCSSADLEDATTEEDMKDFRHDFQLAHYWLGRSYLHLDQPDNARIAFQKAATHLPRKGETDEVKSTQQMHAQWRSKRISLEQQSYKIANEPKTKVEGAADMSVSPAENELPVRLPDDAVTANPVIQATDKADEFFSVPFQKEVNLILVIEAGTGPLKYLVGENGYTDAIVRNTYPERKMVVYLDGYKAGPAFQALDLFHQADTRGTSEKDRIQIAKGITQSVLRRMPYVGNVAAYWDVRADWRYWRLMPGEVHIFAAKVKPGLHNINIQCVDANGYKLPRYTLTRYHVPVSANNESIYLFYTYPEADNTYGLAK